VLGVFGIIGLKKKKQAKQTKEASKQEGVWFSAVCFPRKVVEWVPGT
jgi:hypothetical protein